MNVHLEPVGSHKTDPFETGKSKYIIVLPPPLDKPMEKLPDEFEVSVGRFSITQKINELVERQNALEEIVKEDVAEMKKTLHGKRYIRSRASVMSGRQKRLARKMERWNEGLSALSKFMQNDFSLWIKAVENAVTAFREASLAAVPVMREIVNRINNSFPNANPSE